MDVFKLGPGRGRLAGTVGRQDGGHRWQGKIPGMGGRAKSRAHVGGQSPGYYLAEDGYGTPRATD